MRTFLIVSVCAVALIHACRHPEDGAAGRGGETLVVRREARARSGPGASGRTWTSSSEAQRRESGSRDDSGATGRGGRYNRGELDWLDELDEDAPDERPRDRRSRPSRPISDDELLVSLKARRLSDGVYELDPSSPRSGRLTEEELDELLERVNARSGWIKVIRVGPWRIRVVRDTFFDPYRRDSGWIDIDELDGAPLR